MLVAKQDEILLLIVITVLVYVMNLKIRMFTATFDCTAVPRLDQNRPTKISRQW